MRLFLPKPFSKCLISLESGASLGGAANFNYLLATASACPIFGQYIGVELDGFPRAEMDSFQASAAVGRSVA